jgi:ribosome-associated translation inhibitor RaiA
VKALLTCIKRTVAPAPHIERAGAHQARAFEENDTVALQITFHGVTHSGAVEAKIRSRASKLARSCDSIIGCRVAIEAPHRHSTTGREYEVRVEVAVPGEKIVASGKAGHHQAFADLILAVRRAFDAVRRQLEEYEERRHRQISAHIKEIPA